MMLKEPENMRTFVEYSNNGVIDLPRSAPSNQRDVVWNVSFHNSKII